MKVDNRWGIFGVGGRFFTVDIHLDLAGVIILGILGCLEVDGLFGAMGVVVIPLWVLEIALGFDLSPCSEFCEGNV